MPNKIVLCHGTFDLLHIGHIKHLQKAAGLGDQLVVSVTADEYVKKGPGRPYFNQDQRMDALYALECVDRVILCHGLSAEESIREVGDVASTTSLMLSLKVVDEGKY